MLEKLNLSVTPGWAAVLAAAIAAALASAANAAPAGDATHSGLQGRWVMAPATSSFDEAVTGPAPDAATVVFTRDDAGHLAYELVESRGGTEIARGVYDLSLGGAGSISAADGGALAVTAERDATGDVVVRAPAVDGAQALIRVRRTGPDTARLEHDLLNHGVVQRLETISLVRSQQTASR